MPERDNDERSGRDERAGPRWHFLTNHGHMMVYLGRHPDARIRDIALAIGITERSAQGILAELEREGYVTKTKIGRRNQYQVHADLKFRHPEESEQSISALLRIFN